MRYLIVLLLILPLQGCWFFMVPIPTALFQEGNACAGEGAYVGQRLKHDDGRVGTVEKVIGRNERCKSGSRPMLVEVRFD